MARASFVLNTIALDPNRWTPDQTPRYHLRDLLPSLTAAGFQRLEVWQHHLSTLSDEETDVLAEALHAAGTDTPVIGFYPVLDLHGDTLHRHSALAEQMLARAARLGARVLKIFAGRQPSGALAPRDFARATSVARTLVRRAADHGLRVTAETHPDTLCDGVGATMRFLAAVDHEALSLCYQPFDLENTGRAVADYEMLAEHVTHVHLQGRRDDAFAPLADAGLDFSALFRKMAQRGFEGPACLEFVAGCAPTDPADFDLSAVLLQAVQDRAFLAEAARSSGLEWVDEG